MGKQTDENAIFLHDQQSHRMFSLLLGSITDDAQLPTFREVLRSLGIGENKPPHSVYWACDFALWSCSFQKHVEDLNHRVTRGECLLWRKRTE